MSACLTLMTSIELLYFCFFLYFPIPGPFTCTKLSFLESKLLIFIEFSRTFQIALIAHSVRDQPIPQKLSHLTISDTFHLLNYSYSYKFYFHLNQKVNYLILIHRKIKKLGDINWVESEAEWNRGRLFCCMQTFCIVYLRLSSPLVLGTFGDDLTELHSIFAQMTVKCIIYTVYVCERLSTYHIKNFRYSVWMNARLILMLKQLQYYRMQYLVNVKA